MSAPKRDVALREQGDGENQSDDTGILAALLEEIKSELLAGKTIRLIDYPSDQRPLAVGAIAKLRDELPIKAGWVTVRESHLSETRLRARRYSIPGEFLRESGHD